MKTFLMAGLKSVLKTIGVGPSATELEDAYLFKQKKREDTAKRLLLLNPNGHSDVSVEYYVFSLTPTQFASGAGIYWGSPNGWTATKNPAVVFRAEQLNVNVRVPGLVYLHNIQAANIHAQLGAVADAITFTPGKLSLPVIPPQNSMQVAGTWTKFIVPGFKEGEPYTLTLDFTGWATVTP